MFVSRKTKNGYTKIQICNSTRRVRGLNKSGKKTFLRKNAKISQNKSQIPYIPYIIQRGYLPLGQVDHAFSF